MIDIDLSSDSEVSLRFNQICACFAILVRDGVEPKSVYQELYAISLALMDKYCKKSLNSIGEGEDEKQD